MFAATHVLSVNAVSHTEAQLFKTWLFHTQAPCIAEQLAGDKATEEVPGQMRELVSLQYVSQKHPPEEGQFEALADLLHDAVRGPHLERILVHQIHLVLGACRT